MIAFQPRVAHKFGRSRPPKLVDIAPMLAQSGLIQFGCSIGLRGHMYVRSKLPHISA